MIIEAVRLYVLFLGRRQLVWAVHDYVSHQIVHLVLGRRQLAWAVHDYVSHQIVHLVLGRRQLAWAVHDYVSHQIVHLVLGCRQLAWAVQEKSWKDENAKLRASMQELQRQNQILHEEMEQVSLGITLVG